MKQSRLPVIKENRFTFDIVSSGTFFSFLVLAGTVIILGASLYINTRPNYNQRDNDLKYRYIKMKGEAFPKQILELENIFEVSRDNAKIRQMYKDVKQYEDAISKQVIVQEQVRLNKLEVDRLNDEAKSLKNK